MTTTDILFEEIETTANELFYHHPPRIELQGWWWKKYIPFYQRQRKVMQILIDQRWEDSMRRDFHEMLEMEKRNEDTLLFKSRRF